MKIKNLVKGPIALVLLCYFFSAMIYAAAPQVQLDEKIVGIWKKDGSTATFVFRKDGSGTQVVMENFSMDFVWRMTESGQIKVLGKMFANASKSKREELSTTYDYVLNGNELMLNGVTYTRIQ